MSIIVAINNSADLLQVIRERLIEQGHTVYLRHPNQQTYKLIDELNPDVLLLDLVDPAAYQLLFDIDSTPGMRATPRIVMIAPWQKDDFQNDGLVISARVLIKPFTADELISSISWALHQSPTPAESPPPAHQD